VRAYCVVTVAACVIAGSLAHEASAQARRRAGMPMPAANPSAPSFHPSDPADQPTSSDVAAMPAGGATQGDGRVLRGSQVIGTQVWDPQSQQLGTIKDLIVDYSGSCPMAFFAIAPQIAGIEGGYIVVPFDVIRLRYDNRLRRDYVVVDLTLDQFRRAPRLEGDNWDRIRDRQFLGHAKDFYQRTERSAARPVTPREGERTGPRDATRSEMRTPADTGQRSDDQRRSDLDRARRNSETIAPSDGSRPENPSGRATPRESGKSTERSGSTGGGRSEPSSGSHSGQSHSR
jgi:hypothetical protein